MVSVSAIKGALRALKALSLTSIFNKSVSAFKGAITPILGIYFGSDHGIVKAVKAIPSETIHKLSPIVLSELSELSEDEISIFMGGDYRDARFVKNIIYVANNKLQKTLSPEVVNELKPIFLEIFRSDAWILSIIKASTSDEAQQNLPELVSSLAKLTEKNWADVLDLADYAYHNGAVKSHHVYGIIHALDKMRDYLSTHSLDYLQSVLGAILVDDKYVSGIIQSFDDNVTKEMAPKIIHSLAKLTKKEMSILVGEQKGDIKSYKDIVNKLKDLKDIVKAENIDGIKPIIKAIFGVSSSIAKVFDHLDGEAFEQAVHIFDVAEKMSYGVKTGFGNLLTKTVEFSARHSYDEAHHDLRDVLHDNMDGSL